MSDERKDPEGQDEDFEPLDKFFAPIEDVDWPEEGSEETKGQAPKAAGEGRQAPPTGDLNFEDDLLGGELSADPLAGIDADLPVADPVPGPVGQEAGDAPQEPTAEMSGQEWEELRLDVGGGAETSPTAASAWEDEEDDYEEAELEAGAVYPEPEEDRELTLEDLKNPPPEYADLPGPAGEAGEPEIPVRPARDVVDEPEPTVPEGAEPPLEQVEAAADHFAEALRGEGESEGLQEPPPPIPDQGELPPAEVVEQDLLSDLDREPAPPPTVTVGVTDTLGGPSWQEPTSEEVSTAPSQQTLRGRNLPLAFLSGIILVVIGIGAAAWGKAPFTVIAGAVIVIALGELYAALHRKGYQPATALGLVMGGLMTAAAYLRGEAGSVAMFAVGTVFTFLWFMATPAKLRQNVVVNIGMTLLPLAYVGFLGSFVLMTLRLNGGMSLVLAVVGLAVGNDIAAYAFGSLWGDRALAPSLSPRKSWEGAIAATLVTILAALLILPSLDTFANPAGGNGYGAALGLAVVIALFAPLGDLSESMIKRDLGLKDMGSLIPGHGGVLDRVDSIVFVAPATFYFFRLFLF